MRMRRLANRAIRRAISPFHPNRGAILLYHRIFEPSSDPQLLCVSPLHFAEHLAHLAENFHVISLLEMVRSASEGRLQDHSIALTFDDGYADSFGYAKPLLESYNIPATIFVTTGYTGKANEFWWDELERLVLLSPELPERLILVVKERKVQWDIGQWCGRLTDEKRTELNRWNVEMSIDPTPRHRAYRELNRLLYHLSPRERDMALASLRAQTRNIVPNRPDYRSLSPSEIHEMANHGLLEIGAHTVNHPVLADLPSEVQLHEMQNCRSTLEEITGQSVRSFAYPFGTESSVSQETFSLVREIGFEVACANVPETVTFQPNRYWMPRFLVRDWNADLFSEKLRQFFRA